MYEFRLAYRHGNGEIEGFTGAGSNIKAARRNAILRAEEKAGHTPHPFDPARLIENADELTPDERATVRTDWKY